MIDFVSLDLVTLTVYFSIGRSAVHVLELVIMYSGSAPSNYQRCVPVIREIATQSGTHISWASRSNTRDVAPLITRRSLGTAAVNG